MAAEVCFSPLSVCAGSAEHIVLSDVDPTFQTTGQGNIGADPTPYVDGEIVRAGVVGDQGDGAYSAGVCPSPSLAAPSPPPPLLLLLLRSVFYVAKIEGRQS